MHINPMTCILYMHSNRAYPKTTTGKKKNSISVELISNQFQSWNAYQIELKTVRWPCILHCLSAVDVAVFGAGWLRAHRIKGCPICPRDSHTQHTSLSLIVVDVFVASYCMCEWRDLPADCLPVGHWFFFTKCHRSFSSSINMHTANRRDQLGIFNARVNIEMTIHHHNGIGGGGRAHTKCMRSNVVCVVWARWRPTHTTHCVQRELKRCAIIDGKCTSFERPVCSWPTAMMNVIYQRKSWGKCSMHYCSCRTIATTKCLKLPRAKRVRWRIFQSFLLFIWCLLSTVLSTQPTRIYKYSNMYTYSTRGTYNFDRRSQFATTTHSTKTHIGFNGLLWCVCASIVSNNELLIHTFGVWCTAHALCVCLCVVVY